MADSLQVRYGTAGKNIPKGCSKALHLFTYTNAVDLGDMAWAYNNINEGVYFFWDEDTTAFPASDTASAFSGGQLALAGFGGIILGAAGSLLLSGFRRRRKKQGEAV